MLMMYENVDDAGFSCTLTPLADLIMTPLVLATSMLLKQKVHQIAYINTIQQGALIRTVYMILPKQVERTFRNQNVSCKYIVRPVQVTLHIL